jgi:hypothetical protein
MIVLDDSINLGFPVADLVRTWLGRSQQAPLTVSFDKYISFREPAALAMAKQSHRWESATIPLLPPYVEEVSLKAGVPMLQELHIAFLGDHNFFTNRRSLQKF